MYLGKVVELGAASAVVRSPRHPYTQALISAVPRIDEATERPRIVLAGEMPSPIHVPPGCPFHPRCPVAVDRCRVEIPVLREITAGHWAACHLAA
jgi:oligopeptide/dipeptide ABC transporter ATP-binding protein